MDLLMRQDLHLEQKVVLHLPYETVGDLELLSLHRIRHRIGSMSVDEGVRNYLVGQLVKENKGYIKRTGNNWRCITPNDMHNAVDGLESYLKQTVEAVVATFDAKEDKETLRKVMGPKINTQMETVKTWFHDKYDDILYDTTGTIPYGVVMALRKKFSRWALEKTNPFADPIENVIEEAARNQGINPDHYHSHEDMWMEMGGRLPERKSK